MSERVRYPGFRWGYGPTTDWEAPGGPWAWVAYTAPDPAGLSTRTAGFADSRDAARRMVGDRS